MSDIIPRGKYAGQRLDDLDDNTVHLVWAAWNGIESLRRNPFFSILVDENQRRKSRPTVNRSNLDRLKKLLTMLTPDELFKAAELVAGESERRSTVVLPSSKQKHTESDWEPTHWRFTGPTGREEWILNGVAVDTTMAPF